MLDFGDKLRRFRKSAGKTQGEFGQMVGAPQSTISKWEKGHRPSAEHAVSLQKLTGIPIEEILGLGEPAGPKAEQNRGFAEVKQSGFAKSPPEASAVDGTKSKKPGRHPAFGVWKGKVTLLPDYDYTQPADPDWGKVYED